MGQFLRPDSNVTLTNVTGSYTDIDEASASDADWVEATVNTIAALTVGLSNPSGTPGPGTTTFRYRIGKTGANSVNVTPRLYEGATLIDAGSGQSAPSSATTYEWTPDTSGVSNWNNLRLNFGFSRNATTYAKLYWAELEVPSPSYSMTANGGSFTLGGTAVNFILPRTLTAAGGSFTLTGTAAGLNRGRTITAAGATYTLTGTAAGLVATGAYSLPANGGTFVLAGTAANLLFGSKVAAASGSFALSGTAVTLLKGFRMNGGGESYTLTLTAAELDLVKKTYTFPRTAARTGASASRQFTFRSA
jgi:hypothetical protein